VARGRQARLEVDERARGHDEPCQRTARAQGCADVLRTSRAHAGAERAGHAP
jgi:hypothetical protein